MTEHEFSVPFSITIKIGKKVRIENTFPRKPDEVLIINFPYV